MRENIIRALSGRAIRGLAVLFGLGFGVVSGAAVAEPSAEEVVSKCHYKDPGSDQESLLSITLISKDGDQRKNVYKRLWKNYFGKKDIADKMVLYTMEPTDAKGTGFMRWGYVAAAGKLADQWIYLPHLRKVRRVSVRDPGDSFLGSDLTYGDIEERTVDADTHVVKGMESLGGVEHYVVESVPKEENALYSKRVSYYSNVGWEKCVRSKTDYYDRRGTLLKVQDLTWQQVSGAWAWDRVTVVNKQNGHSSIFEVTDVEVDTGLKERQFTERALKKAKY